jgi:hypothetical protein
MFSTMKPVEDLEDLLAHLLPGDWMLVSFDNDGPHSLRLTAADVISRILDFSGNIKGIEI